MSSDESGDKPGAGSWWKNNGSWVASIAVGVLVLGGSIFTTTSQGDALRDQISSESETNRQQILTQAAVDREGLALEQDRLRDAREKAIDDVLALWIPFVVGEDVPQQLEALAVLAAVMPDQIGGILDDVFSILADQQGVNSDLIEQARDTASERADAVEWVIVIGERQQLVEAEGLVVDATEKGFGSPQVYRLGGDAFAVVLSGFETRDDADVTLISVRATLQEGAQVVDVNAWCLYPVVDETGSVLCAPTSYDQLVLLDGPKVFWPLATPTAVNLRDLVGSSDLLPRGDGGEQFVPVFSEGPGGIGGMGFNATSQQRLSSKFNPQSELGTGSWTLETWVKLEEANLALDDSGMPGPMTVIGGWNSTAGERWYLSVEEGRRVCVGIGAGSKVCAPGTMVDDGTWHHIVVTYHAEAGAAALFIDSVNAELKTMPWSAGERLIDVTMSVGAMFNDNVAKIQSVTNDDSVTKDHNVTRDDDGEGWEEYWNGGVSRVAVYGGLL
ncbi:MAG: LamG domain-containing protein, partial [Actinomycetia bacterium]|nr:LamG domain-containing protein [Actinomycetes bacterium]